MAVQQFPLPILLAEDVFMGPSVPVGDRLPPGGAGNELRQFHTLPFHRRLRCPFWRDGKQARPTGLERLSTQKINEVPTCHVPDSGQGTSLGPVSVYSQVSIGSTTSGRC